MVDTYNVGDELEGTVTKVVTFGAFVEILDGVEGLVHISELAQHHVENPRELIRPGDPVRVRILEIDSERRRLSLSIKRVEGQVLPVRGQEDDSGVALDDVPELGLSEDVFATPPSEDASASEAGAASDDDGEATAQNATASDADPSSEAESPADQQPAAASESDSSSGAEQADDQ